MSIHQQHIFGAAASVHVYPGRVEIHLPDWSGRLNPSMALSGIAELREFLDKAEAMIREMKG